MASKSFRVRAVTDYPVGDFAAIPGAEEIRGGGFRVWTPRTPQRMGLHSHAQWEFCLLVSGAMDWWIEDEFHAIRSGELFVIRPNERHDGADRIRYRSAICWLGLSCPLERLPGLTTAHAAALAAGFGALTQRRFPADPSTPGAFAEVLAAARAAEPLRAPLVRASLHRLLIGILTSHASCADMKPSPPPDDRIQRAASILGERLGAPIAVAELARSVGLSRTVLHQRFVAELGLSPMTYWTRLRVERAKELLSGGGGSRAIAAILGFASAQHFARVFRGVTGLAPRAWLASRR
jgi:AraC-like DNA-binding protein